jgi:drug/metabolite transporter (DMT)-like permease
LEFGISVEGGFIPHSHMSAQPSTASRPAGPSRLALAAAFATIYIVWGSTYLAMRVGVGVGAGAMPPLLMAGARFLIAGAIMFALVRIRREPWPTARQCQDNAIAATLMLLLGNGLVMWASQHIPSGITSLIVGMTPIYMTLLEWAQPGGRRPGPYTTAGIITGFVGIILLSAPWEEYTNATALPLTGLLAIMCSSFFWATGTVWLHRIKNPAPALTATTLQMLIGGALLLAGGTLRGEIATVRVAGISVASWLSFVYLIIVGSLIAYSTYTWLVKHSTPARVSTYAYVNPVIAVFLGWLILDEPVTPRTLLAAALIIAAVAIIIVRKNKRLVSETTKTIQ